MFRKNSPVHPEYQPHLVWVYSGRLDQVFDSATWLEPTRELRKLGWKVSLVTTGPADLQAIQGVQITRIPTIDIYFFRHLVFHLILIWKIILNWHPIDFILFHQTSAPWLLPLQLIRTIIRAKSPLFVMDTRTVLMEDLKKGNWRDRVRGQVYKMSGFLANHWVDGQTVITRRMADCVGIPPQRLWGIWSTGVDPAFFSKARSIRKWPASHEPVHIVYIGVINYERNLLALCKAVEMANLEGMRFTLTITGEGTQRQELERFAADTDGIIRIRKAVTHDQIPDLLGRAHVGAIPFPDEEKFRVSSPVKLFEYLAAGLPVLATRIVCNTDIIGDGAFVFWAEDSSVEGFLAALRIAWERRDQMKDLGKLAALAAEDHSWRSSAEHLSAALSTHLTRKATPIKLSL